MLAQTLELPLSAPFCGVVSLSTGDKGKAEEQEHTISVTFDGLREEKIFLANHLSEALVRSCSSAESSLEQQTKICKVRC